MTSRFLSTASGTATTSGTTCTATLASGTVGATALVVLVAVNQSSTLAATVSSVTDTAGNAYTKAIGQTAAPNVAGNTSVEIWYKLTPTTSAGSQTYTVNLANAGASVAMRVVALGGTTTLDAISALVQTNAANNSVSMTTSTSDEIVLTALAVGTSPSGTTMITSAPGDFAPVVATAAAPSASSQLYVIFESRPGARQLTQNFSQTGSGNYAAVQASFVAPLTYPTPGNPGISITSTLTKDPGAALDWVFNWINWLGASEAISSFAVTSDSGLNVDYSASPASNFVVAWLSGGQAGNEYAVTCSITTSLGRTDNRSITIKVLNQ